MNEVYKLKKQECLLIYVLTRLAVFNIVALFDYLLHYN